MKSYLVCAVFPVYVFFISGNLGEIVPVREQNVHITINDHINLEMALNRVGEVKKQKLEGILIETATVEATVPVRCFFARSEEQPSRIRDDSIAVRNEAGQQHRISHTFDPTRELAVPFAAAEQLYCYNTAGTYRANNRNQEADDLAGLSGMITDNDDNTPNIGVSNGNEFRLVLDKAGGGAEFVDVYIPRGQVWGTSVLSETQIRSYSGVTEVRLYQIPFQNEGEVDNPVNSPAFGHPRWHPYYDEEENGLVKGPFPRNGLEVDGSRAICFAVVHPRGIHPLIKGQPANFGEDGVTIKAITCFKADHTQDDIERWVSGG